MVVEVILFDYDGKENIVDKIPGDLKIIGRMEIQEKFLEGVIIETKKNLLGDNFKTTGDAILQGIIDLFNKYKKKI